MVVSGRYDIVFLHDFLPSFLFYQTRVASFICLKISKPDNVFIKPCFVALKPYFKKLLQGLKKIL